MVLRVNDLVDPSVDDRALRGVLAARSIPVSDRTTPAGPAVQAVLTTTAAGTVVTLEQRLRAGQRRGTVLRRLTRTLEDLLEEGDRTARDRREPV